MSSDEELFVSVERLAVVHDRYDAAQGDPTGTSSGDDGENKDGLNHPES